jgi:ABC-type multidrug transport system permease subunit
MEISTKSAPNKVSILWKDLGWRKWLLAILFPVPMGSMWLTIAWAALFCLLAYVLVKNSAKQSKLPPKLG